MRVVIDISFQEVNDARDKQTAQNHRELVQQKFLKNGFVVVNFNELKFFVTKRGFRVEGDTNVSILSA